MKANGLEIARCTVERLMTQYELQGVWRGKGKITTHSRDDQKRAGDLINRNFSALISFGLQILPISRQLAVGFIPLLFLMCLLVLSSVGKYLIV